ncbi:MAG: nickel pincer cofactor biosynthesis protein LarC [Elusimicrobia bacterium]|nr:nickel pincer cofactor biosynthesis protein LarC [Elusimicrobiota bacterium]
MKIAYFNCSSGISGDMILSSLVDAGVNEKHLISLLRKIPIAKYSMKFSNIQKNGVHAKFLHLTGGEQIREFSKVKKIIKNSKIPENIKQQGLKIYSKLAYAESKVHSTLIDSVHFHQIAEVDTIIDIFGTAIGLEALKIEKVYSSPLNLGVPAPATIEIIKGIPVYSTSTINELVTPTGAAIISVLAEKYGPIPEMRILQTGTGAGQLDFEKPNVLRIYIGESEKKYFSDDKKIVLETNIDDMDARIFPYVQNKLLQNGACDVWFSNIYSKKGRPGIILSAITTEENELKIADIIFSETTTLGIRRVPVSRWILKRKKEGVYKIAKLKYLEKKTVEYDEAVKIATKKNIPLLRIL